MYLATCNEPVSNVYRPFTSRGALVLVDGDHVGQKFAPKLIELGERVEVYGRAAPARAWQRFASKHSQMALSVYAVGDARGAADTAIMSRITQLAERLQPPRPATVMIVSADRAFDKAGAHFRSTDITVFRVSPNEIVPRTNTFESLTKFVGLNRLAIAGGSNASGHEGTIGEAPNTD